MITVWITVRDGDPYAECRSPFEAREVIKTLPPFARQWDKPRKTWLIDARLAGVLADRLRGAGFTVDVITLPGQAEPPPAARGAGSSWCDLMYAALGVTLGDKVYAAIVRVLHPDAGGDTAAMQQLNVARDRAHGR